MSQKMPKREEFRFQEKDKILSSDRNEI